MFWNYNNSNFVVSYQTTVLPRQSHILVAFEYSSKTAERDHHQYECFLFASIAIASSSLACHLLPTMMFMTIPFFFIFIFCSDAFFLVAW